MTTPHPHPTNDRAPIGFSRDRLTLLAYSLAGLFGYAIGAMGPAMPLLREDLSINRTIGGLHFTMVAAGSVVFGFFVDRLSARWGRRRVLWIGSGFVAWGALAVGTGPHPVVTLIGAAAIGSGGSSLLATVQATLADRHAAHRAVAFTESNTATSVGTVVPGLLIGAFVSAGIGWRPAMVVPAVVWTALYLSRRGEQFPPANRRAGPGRQPALPRGYWLFWAAVVPAVGAEWSVGAWGAGYLVDVAGTTEGSASVLMTAYFGAIATGRLIGSRLARRFEPLPLLLGSVVLGFCGILGFWLSNTTPWVVAGLFVTGLGVSVVFPMLLTLAVATAPERSDAASARISISAGAAVLVAPVSLGAIADASGIQVAFATVPGLFVIIAAFAIAGHRATH